MRRLGTLVAVLAVLGAVTAIALAQSTTPPTLAYTNAATGAPSGPTTAAPGATTFTSHTTEKHDTDLTVVRVHDGADPAQVQKDVDKKLSEDQIEALPIDIVGDVSAVNGHDGKFTANLEAGSYLVLNTTSDKHAPSIVLTVSGTPTGAVAPTPRVTVSMHDYKFELNRSLIHNANARFINKGKRIHMAIGFKTSSSKNASKMVSALRHGNQKAFERLIRGEGPTAEPISPGRSVDIPIRSGKGNYVFVCFWQSKASKGKPHFILGMEKAFKIK
jgi:hypothetical protein